MDHPYHRAEDFAADPSFQRWVMGEANGAAWEAWCAAHPEHRQEVERARRLVRALRVVGHHPPAARTEASLAAVKRRLRHHDRHRTLWRWARVAAVALLLLTSGLIYWKLQHRPPALLEAVADQTRTLRLPDGSWVVLTAGARLSYPADWSEQADREVWLTGQAYFKVRRRPPTAGGRRFTVHTRDLNVEVLGTRFKVETEPLATQVVLEEGRVELTLQQTERPATPRRVVLQPGDLVRYSRRNDRLEQRQVRADRYVAAPQAALELRDQTLGQIAGRIGAAYGLRTRLSSPALASVEIHGTFPLDDLDALLRDVALVGEVRVQRAADQITFSPR